MLERELWKFVDLWVKNLRGKGVRFIQVNSRIFESEGCDR